MGLLDELRKYVKDALPGGLLNPEVNTQGILDGAALSTTAVPVLGDLLGLGADLHRYKNEPESRTLGNFALSGLGMLPFVPAMTAWHGSPHKFDKFDMSKIGTGEGAQAYGHGLYLSESPDVGRTYQAKVSAMKGQTPQINGRPINWDDPVEAAAFEAHRHGGDRNAAADFYGKTFKSSAVPEILQNFDKFPKLPKIDINGALYKTDIPDEAVARFLDWDKPLSQQAPEVQAALEGVMTKDGWQTYLGAIKKQDAGDAKALRDAGYNMFDYPSAAGGIYQTMASELGHAKLSKMLQQSGIPGIKYLDGGSRSAGTGSSNFVAFDPEMIRILERNGQETGLAPWKPGEYGGLLK